MRALFMAFVAVGGMCVAFVLSAAVGLKTLSWIAFLITLAVSGGLVFLLYKAAWGFGRQNMDEWLRSIGPCDFRYSWDGTGIAISKAENKIFLASKFSGRSISKSYPLTAVRSWEYQIAGKTIYNPQQVHVFGGGLLPNMQASAHNIGQGLGASVATVLSDVKAKENTGLFVTVSDVETPRWFVKFKPQRELRMELERWMERLNQTMKV